MENKYGLGSARVAHEHHDAKLKATGHADMACRFCGATHLTLCLTMHDHRCETCGKWQNDMPMGYSTGRSADY